MALAEDAATILDEFVHDASNLPAEIAHLLEEIQAKDQVIAECRMFINAKDSTIQKHVKQNGGHVKHPKEDIWLKSIMEHYDKAQALQEDKLALSEKASVLLDRQVRRLDIKIRNLQNEGSMLEDVHLPSLLHASPANLVDPVSANRSGVSTPLNILAAPATMSGAGASLAHAAISRAASSTLAQTVRSAPQAPMSGSQSIVLPPNPAIVRTQRETSQGAPDAKRRRFNGTLGTLPLPSSNLARQSSAGPGTPKAATPGSRAGSLGPRPKKMPKRPGSDHPLRKKTNRPGLKHQRRLKSGNRASPSTTGDDNSDASGSEDENHSQTQGQEGEDDEAADGAYEEDGDDNELYCICRNPSHGAMVACDNNKCQYEWFHYECVGLKEEPKGRWLCPECRKLPPKDLKIVK